MKVLIQQIEGFKNDLWFCDTGLLDTQFLEDKMFLALIDTALNNENGIVNSYKNEIDLDAMKFKTEVTTDINNSIFKEPLELDAHIKIIII